MILFRKRRAEAKIPVKTYKCDAGYDLVCLDRRIVWPWAVVDLDTGLDVKVPDYTWGSIKTRSSTFRHRKLLVLEGVIDPGYTGKLGVLVFNPTIFPKIVKKGDRLAQLVVIKKCDVGTRLTNKMPLTMRGSNGFGHSGR